MYIDNLVALSRLGVILTWAVPGQRGLLHINERDNAYVIAAMGKRGMLYDHEESKSMRKNVASLVWLKNTILVFVKDRMK